MTIHRSKGLEYPAIFLQSCNTDLLPSARARDELEEANLFYVAITRAKEFLYIDGTSEYVDRVEHWDTRGEDWE